MSAAEKLRVLDEAMPHAPTHIATWPLFWEFRNALPQMLAVVEAAERVDARTNEEAWRFRPARMRDLRAALAALDEALS